MLNCILISKTSMSEINQSYAVTMLERGGGGGRRLLHCFAISLSFIKIMAYLLTITTIFPQKTFLCMPSNCPFFQFSLVLPLNAWEDTLSNMCKSTSEYIQQSKISTCDCEINQAHGTIKY